MYGGMHRSALIYVDSPSEAVLLLPVATMPYLGVQKLLLCFVCSLGVSDMMGGRRAALPDQLGPHDTSDRE